MADGAELLGNLAIGTPVNLVLAFLAWRARTVRPSGVLGGLAVGIAIFGAAGWRGFSVLAGMFVIGTFLTRFGYARKSALGVAEERGGARGASHAFANAGTAAAAAILAWATGNPLWNVGLAGALATASMDTAGSEIGPLYGRRTVSMKSFRSVPPGTEGAVSLEGTLAGLAAAATLGGIGWGVGLLDGAAVPAVVAGAAAGNLYEALAGSRHLLPHAWLNATNTLVGGGTAVAAALLFA